MSNAQHADWETLFEQDYDGKMRFSCANRVNGLQVPHGMTDMYADELSGVVEVTVWTVYGDNPTVEAWRIAKEDYPELTFVTPLDDDGNDPEDDNDGSAQAQYVR